MRHVLALRNKSGRESLESLQGGTQPTSEAMTAEGTEESPAASSSGPTAELPPSLTPDLVPPTADLAAQDPTMETTDADRALKPYPYRLDPEPAQIQAGCTAVVAIFQVRHPSHAAKLLLKHVNLGANLWDEHENMAFMHSLEPPDSAMGYSKLCGLV